MFRRLKGKASKGAKPPIVNGDQARDMRDWSSARHWYRMHLDVHPDDGAIWVQLGHAEKEIGNFDAAMTAYLRAVELQHHLSDTYLQIGHLCKITRDLESARNFYSRSLEHGPDGADATQELLQIFASTKATAVLEPPREMEDLQEVHVAGLVVDHDSLEAVVKLAFRSHLKREPSTEELRSFTGILRNGRPIAYFLNDVENSPEAAQRRTSQSLLADLSDGEFVLAVSELLFAEGAANPIELEEYKRALRSDPARRQEFVNRLIARRVEQRTSTEEAHDPLKCWVMGTSDFLTPAIWQERLAKVASEEPRPSKVFSSPRLTKRFNHSGDYAVTAIASMYRGGQFIEGFLENITSQTLFDRSELIIVDAASPDNESRVISEYQKHYPNIIHHRTNYRIGIYDAWNVGVSLARGKYLTNTNLDDLRRRDSLELQCRTLDECPGYDVVYQDFYYSFDSKMSFSDVANMGFRSKLPILTANNLLCFNSPHNAPMWRATLHDAVGLFDTSLKSAGDYEFWLRCMHAGRKFMKMNEPHVVYYQNPQGISTSPETRGVQEAYALRRKYARLLISPILRASSAEFCESINADATFTDSDMSYFDIAQATLLQLGSKRVRG